MVRPIVISMVVLGRGDLQHGAAPFDADLGSGAAADR